MSGKRQNFERLLQAAYDLEHRRRAQALARMAEITNPENKNFSMQRDTKFASAFCLLGIGLPFLIAKLLGLGWAMIVSAICVILGLIFLIAGYFHREDHKHKSPRKFWRWVIAGSSLSTFAVLICIGVWGGNAENGEKFWSHLIKKPETRLSLINELNDLLNRKELEQLDKRLDSIDGVPAFRDIDLYFRGALYSNTSPGPNPETYLSLVPQESDLFLKAQEWRLHNLASSPNEQAASAIIESLDRANIRNPIYFRLLLIKPNLSHRQIVALYDDFVSHNQAGFDFTEMQIRIRATKGIYLKVDLNEVMKIPGLVLLFQFLQLQAAHQECMEDESVLTAYQTLTKNFDDGQLNISFTQLCINPAIKSEFEELKNQHIIAGCKQ